LKIIKLDYCDHDKAKCICVFFSQATTSSILLIINCDDCNQYTLQVKIFANDFHEFRSCKLWLLYSRWWVLSESSSQNMSYSCWCKFANERADIQFSNIRSQVNFWVKVWYKWSITHSSCASTALLLFSEKTFLYFCISNIHWLHLHLHHLQCVNVWQVWKDFSSVHFHVNDLNFKTHDFWEECTFLNFNFNFISSLSACSLWLWHCLDAVCMLSYM